MPESEKEKGGKKKKKREKVKAKKKEAIPTKTVSSPQKSVAAVKVAKAQRTDMSRTKSTPTKLNDNSQPASRVATAKKSSSIPRTASAQKHTPIPRTDTAEKTPDTEAGVKTPVSLSVQSFPPPSLSPTPRTLSTNRLTLPQSGSHTPANAPARSSHSIYNGALPTRHENSSPARPAPFR